MAKLIAGDEYTIARASYASGSPVDYCVLDSARTLITYTDSSTGYCYAKIKQEVDGVIYTGAEIIIASVALYYTLSCAKLDTDKAICFYGDATNSTINAVVLTISGLTITANTVYSLSETNQSDYAACGINTDKAILLYDYDSSVSHAVVVTVSGTVVTFGTPTSITANPNSYHKCLQSDTDKCFYLTYNGSGAAFWGELTAVGTTTITDNYLYGLGGGTTAPSVGKIDATNLICTYVAGQTLYAFIVDTSGTKGTEYSKAITQTFSGQVKALGIIDVTTSTGLLCLTDDDNAIFKDITVDTSTKTCGFVGEYVSALTSSETGRTFISMENDDGRFILLTGSNSATFAKKVLYTQLPTKQGELHMNGKVLRLVSIADAEYSSVRVANGGVIYAADMVKYDPVFANYAVRVQHPINGRLAWREE